MSSDEIINRTVYILRRTDVGNDIYVGSTSQPLWKRFSEHKANAGNPSRLKYYGGSKLYEKIRTVGVYNWKIFPLLTFACNQKTICEFEQEWIKALNANLNTNSSINGDVFERERKIKYFRQNKGMKRYYCEICNVAFEHNFNLKRHLVSLKHSYARLNSLD